MQLARENRAPYLVFSRGLGWLPPGICTDTERRHLRMGATVKAEVLDRSC
jgi:hypothetical protein